MFVWGVKNYLFIVYAWNAGMSNSNMSERPFWHLAVSVLPILFFDVNLKISNFIDIH